MIGSRDTFSDMLASFRVWTGATKCAWYSAFGVWL